MKSRIIFFFLHTHPPSWFSTFDNAVHIITLNILLIMKQFLPCWKAVINKTHFQGIHKWHNAECAVSEIYIFSNRPSYSKKRFFCPSRLCILHICHGCNCVKFSHNVKKHSKYFLVPWDPLPQQIKALYLESWICRPWVIC